MTEVHKTEECINS